MNTPLRQAFWVILAAGVLGGCNGFSSRYEKALASPPPPGQIVGAWEGTWQSEANEHKGELRAVVVRVSHDTFNVHYSAHYSNLLPNFDHETTLKGHFAGSTFHFKGSADLGMLVGTYKSKNDHGTYTLTRAGAKPPEAPVDAPRSDASENFEFHNLATEALGGSEAPPTPAAPAPVPAQPETAP